MATKKLPYYEFARGIYEIDEFDCVSVFLIEGTEKALVIDTGTGIGDLRAVIEEILGGKPYEVAISHNHGDHIGGAGFFDEMWIHEADMDWNGPTGPTLAFRRDYARTIRTRENKHYDYDPETDIRPWPKKPKLLAMKDGQQFPLGGRTVTAYHCPGHTAGEMVFIDDLTKTLFLADACNCNLLMGQGFGKNAREEITAAENGLKRLLAMKEQYGLFYNAHHDFRGFGQSLYPEAIEEAVRCYESILDGTAEYIAVPNSLDPAGPPKIAASYGRIQISYISGDISRFDA